MQIADTQVLRVGDIDGTTRARIEPQLVDIFLRSFKFDNPAMFAERVLFRDPEARLTLLHDERGQIVGFNVFNIDLFEVDGQRHAVVHASAYHLPELRGGGSYAFRRLLAECLRFKLRHPLIPLCLVGEASTPAGYARVRRHFPLTFPRPGTPTPAAVTALVTKVMDKRGFRAVEGDPWRVELGLPIALGDPEQTRRHAEASDNPHFRYYLERNPHFLDGHWLLVHVGLDLAQLWAMLRARATGT